MMSKTHRYQTTTTWTGNLGTGTSQYKAYSRNHEIYGREESFDDSRLLRSCVPRRPCPL